jgi:hypothetical protein
MDLLVGLHAFGSHGGPIRSRLDDALVGAVSDGERGPAPLVTALNLLSLAIM